MQRDPKVRWIRFAVAVGLTLTAIGAIAQGVTVAPTTIVLSRSHTTEMLRFRNQNDVENRFQTSVYSWEQTGDGQEVLHPTEDLIVFPTLFTVKPGDQQIIRVGSATPFDIKEKSYRLFIEQLPSLETPTSAPATAVKLRMRMGLPVFLQPANIVDGAAIGAAEIKGGELRFTLQNTGNVHLLALEVKVAGTSGDNKPVFERSARPRYVPADSSLNFVLAIPPTDCSRVQVFAIHVKMEQNAPGRDVETKRRELSQTLNSEPGSCSK
jgi:fimbrial chaperone protein